MNIVVHGLLVNYSDSGDPAAPAVVMLHGWGASSQNFDALAGRLSGQFRVVQLDLPGFGGTQAPATAWHIQDYAAFVAAFLDKLAITRLDAGIGHSFGGRVLIKAAGRGLIQPARVILMGSAGIKHSDTVRNRVFKVVAKAGKAVTALPGLRGL